MSKLATLAERELTPFRSLLPDFFDTNLDNFFSNRFWNRGWNGNAVPAVNIVENGKNYQIELAAPGMNKKDFKVNVERGVLTISAEKREEKKEEKKNYTRQEYSYNSFSRSFTLPEDAKQDDIQANYEDGVLKLTVGKTATAAPHAKEIAVK